MGTRRTGVPTLVLIAAQLCKYISRYGPTISALYPENVALQAALAAAGAACQTLETQLLLVREYGD